MKTIVFDVGNGSCNFIACNNGNSEMIDCDSNEEKVCPVDLLAYYKEPGRWLSHVVEYTTQHGSVYPLTRLSISHPDLDHIRNVEKVHKYLRPYLLLRRDLSEYPTDVLTSSDDTFQFYEDKFDKVYNGNNPETPSWAFEQSSYHIPMSILQDEDLFSYSSIKNNSSYIFLRKYAGCSILFAGDMEKEGWDWLLNNNQRFVDDISSGVDIFVVPHHGHKSGYYTGLLQAMGLPKLSILSKGSEHDGESDVDTRYFTEATGMNVTGLNGVNDMKKALTTRTNGNIFLEFKPTGQISVFADRI